MYNYTYTAVLFGSLCNNSEIQTLKDSRETYMCKIF